MVYIGQSLNINERWSKHKRAYKNIVEKSQLYQAMREDGIENFIFEVIEECSKELLNERELYWINQYNSLQDGYNMSTIQNLQRKVPVSLVKQIIKDIQESDLNETQIAEKYNVSHTWVSLVNQGKLWYNSNLSYPLRNFLKKKSQPNKCIDCNKIINSQAKRCLQCQKIYQEEKFQERHQITRDQLKKLIREKTFLEIGKMFNVSDNAVRKWCDKYNLPRRKRDIKKYSDEEWNNI